MSTLPEIGKIRYFRFKKSFLVFISRLGIASLPILVIAFSIKGVHAFEGKSDYLRQALRQDLRQEKLFELIKSNLEKSKDADGVVELRDRLELETIVPQIQGPFKNPIGLYEEIYKETSSWEESNPGKTIIHILYSGAALTPSGKVTLDDGHFKPTEAIIFYIKKNQNQ